MQRSKNINFFASSDQDLIPVTSVKIVNKFNRMFMKKIRISVQAFQNKIRISFLHSMVYF